MMQSNIHRASRRPTPVLLLLAGCMAMSLGMHSTLAHAQAINPSNVVSLTASGQVEALQDTLIISLNTTKEGADAQSVQQQLKLAIETALTISKSSAQSGAMEVRTGQFSLYPRYGRDGKLVNWSGTAEVVLEGRDFTRITTTAGKIQSLTVQNVGYALSREQRWKLEAQAQEKAIESFRNKAQAISQSFGFSGYSLREVTVNAQDAPIYGPRPRVLAMSAKVADAESAVPVEAGKTVVTVVVGGSVQLKP